MASEESKTKDDKSETSSNLRQYFGDGGLTEIVLPVLIVALAIYLAIGPNDRLSLQGIVLTFVGVSALRVFLVVSRPLQNGPLGCAYRIVGPGNGAVKSKGFGRARCPLSS